jgi:hypothetical protein
MGIVFMAFICAVLPLDISQLAFAIIGAAFYALLQKTDRSTPKKATFPDVDSAPYTQNARAPKPQSSHLRSLGASHYHSKLKQSAEPALPQEVRAPSAQPVVAPTFRSGGWDGEIQELLLQISPDAEAERIVNELAYIIKKTMRSIIPEMEINGFANGNLAFGKAFGVAVPEVEVIGTASPQILFNRLHGRNSPLQPPAQLDEKKLQKSAIRACTDRLVSAGGFKFRRSAFRGQEPKVTLLVPASLGLFSDSIPIDFSVNVVTPLYNAALLAQCGKMDSRAKELILLVRRWAKDRGICHAAKGHLSPYMWGLLTIYFLQVGDRSEGALLPALEEFQLSTELAKGKKCANSNQVKWKPAETGEAKRTAGHLFKDFVHFYETQFDWHNEAVSISASERKSPSLDLPLHIIVSDDGTKSEVGPSIEDPFQKAQNLSDHMNAVSLKRLKEELARAGALCRQSASLTELLEPWVPAEPQEDEQGDGSRESPSASTAKDSTKKVTEAAPWRRSKTQV